MEDGLQQQLDVAAFASAEWALTRGLSLRPGVRWGYNSAYDAPIMPSLHARWQMGRDWTLRGSYGRGFRAPGLKEQYLFFVDVNHNIRGNPNLAAERSHNLQGSLVWRHLWANFAIEAEYSHFYNQVDNMITLALVDLETLLYSYANLDNFSTHGGRLQVRLLHKYLDLQVGGTVTGLQNDQLASGEGAANIARYSYNTELNLNAQSDLPFWKLRLAAFYKYNGRLQQFVLVGEDDLRQTFMDPFHTLDVTVSRPFWQNRIRFSLGVRNLLNVMNVNRQIIGGAHSGGGGAAPVATGRNFFTQLTFNW
jgi:outer membrane receptor for ferrienterochelin and colicins